ncbi:nuclear transport factor 2 family protein [Mycobacterium sp. 236(2023)]|uniref:nuclear transport factor 2 family protein n=1 Tax=Mycobacterium sp. 236(2023) TaxID=3038163 RepID=UPI002414DD6A|nr:nuclear transport factor 2 family protein [Mycobacterium sp. 236(2023)]MDG4668082.1 nuclear transport factor 2 family protein [Mycobacterium sp. 236(2023)]
MSETERSLADKIEIQELSARYVELCDQNDWPKVVELFTADGVFDAEAVYGHTYTGPAELLSFYEGAPRAVAHHSTSIYSTFDGPDRASARMKMLVLFKRNISSVDYDWQLARVDGVWRIARQSIAVVGRVDIPKLAS